MGPNSQHQTPNEDGDTDLSKASGPLTDHERYSMLNAKMNGHAYPPTNRPHSSAHASPLPSDSQDSELREGESPAERNLRLLNAFMCGY